MKKIDDIEVKIPHALKLKKQIKIVIETSNGIGIPFKAIMSGIGYT